MADQEEGQRMFTMRQVVSLLGAVTVMSGGGAALTVSVRAAVVACAALFMSASLSAAQVGPCLYTPPTAPSTIQGAPFYDCSGFEAWAMTPSPTTFPHAFEDVVPYDLCILPFTMQTWQAPEYPNVRDYASGRTVWNQSSFPGVVIFEGSLVRWIDLPGGGASGYECGVGAEDVEVNGECLCGVPLPEPQDGVGLALGVLGLLGLSRVSPSPYERP